MKKKIKYSLICFLFLTTGCSQATSNLSNNITVAQINDKAITYDEVKKVFHDEYYDLAVNEILDTKLLELEANKLKISLDDYKKETSKDDNLNYLDTLQNNFERKRKLIEKVLLKKVNEADIKNYFDNNKDALHTDPSIEVSLYEMEHEKAMQFINLYNRDKNIKNAEVSASIDPSKVSNEVIHSTNEIYSQLASLKPGEITMIMNKNEHKVALVKSTKRGEPLLWPKDKVAISERYLATNFEYEQKKLFDELHKSYNIKKLDKPESY